MPQAQEVATREEQAGAIVSADAGTIMAVISRAASDPSVNVEKLERLAALYERLKANEAREAYTVAMAKMQPLLPVIDAKSQIVHNSKVISQYAKWEDINDVIKPLLAQHGFALDFSTETIDKGIAVTATLTHQAGHSKQATVPLPIDTSGSKNPVQGIGSSIAYGKRYAAGLVLNLTSRAPTETDNDGGGEVIADEQVQEIGRLLTANKIPLPKFLKVMKADSLADIPAGKYDEAKRQIQEVIDMRAKRTQEPA